ncbi:MAG TPA: emopamil-binding family protein [Polyangiaceae bacterium]|jgi:cholestenol delta-isomerase|nr:emopamil-binding family protein [Polyangiaceae bacterium]
MLHAIELQSTLRALMLSGVFLSAGHIWQRRIVIAWSLFAGLAVLWDFSWCFVFRDLNHASTHDWRLFWAVYGKADERYLRGDRYLVILEFLTGLGSLLNFYVVYELLRGTRERACVALFAVSIMEIYGALIYFGSEALNHFANVDTASFVHTWVMFVGLNSLWLILPSWCIYRLLTQSAGARAQLLRATAE